MKGYYPVTKEDNTPDYRFQVNLEYMGKETKQLVIRFCGDYVKACSSHAEAHAVCQEYNVTRFKAA
tara:strand:- start:97 stop:294 length:198 start_codon:yes stop_codon:yes gene_type:complete